MNNYLDDYDLFLQSITTQTEDLEAGHRVYLSNYLFNHIDQLAVTYPSVLKVLGDDNFKYFSRMYILKNPPTNQDLNIYGSSFAHFLCDQKQLNDYPFLEQLAIVDRQWHLLADSNFSISRGVLLLWESLKSSKDLGQFVIDLDDEVTVSIKKTNGEYCLSVI